MDSSVTSVASTTTATPASNGTPAVSDEKKAAFDMILSAVMNQKPVLADADGDDSDNDDGSELKVGLAGAPSVG